MDVPALTALALLVLAVVFLLAEALLGSDGSFLVLGTVCLLGAAAFGWQTWWPVAATAWWAYLLAGLLGLPLLLAVGVHLLGGPDGNTLPFAADPDDSVQWVGRRGHTLTTMNPGGMVLVDGARCHAETEGILLEPHRPVQVVDVRGNRLVVRATDSAV